MRENFRFNPATNLFNFAQYVVVLTKIDLLHLQTKFTNEVVGLMGIEFFTIAYVNLKLSLTGGCCQISRNLEKFFIFQSQNHRF